MNYGINKDEKVHRYALREGKGWTFWERERGGQVIKVFCEKNNQSSILLKNNLAWHITMTQKHDT